MQRRKIIAGNWKMNLTPGESVTLAEAIRAAVEASTPAAEVVLCPPFPSLVPVAGAMAGSTLQLGAQNMHWEERGAFTGEVSGAMLRDAGCSHVILGHSERRALFGETDETVNRKTKAALARELIPIVCVGETLEQREAGETETVVRRQIAAGLDGLGAAASRVVVAYEPVWAIGTGKTASPAQAQEVHAWIRSALADRTGSEEVAAGIRIQYGGSMKPENAAELLAQPDIDGGLIGGAALKADSFVAIVTAAE